VLFCEIARTRVSGTLAVQGGMPNFLKKNVLQQLNEGRKPDGVIVKSNKPLKAKTNLKARTTLKAKKPVTKATKKHTVAWYKREARKWFNKAVKYRDSEHIDGCWVFDCITCDRKVLFKDANGKTYQNAQAGHFQPEIYSNTRFNELNVNGQCGMVCNKIGLGEQVKYARALDLKYGDGTAARLEEEAKLDKQWTIPELIEIIEDSKKQIAFYESLEKS
jgi:hypothetical protein